MNCKYVTKICFLVFFLCFCFMFSACNLKKHTKIVIKHESKYSQLMQKHTQEVTSDNIIRLGDKNKVDYNYNFGPRDIPMPDFNVINVSVP